MSDAEVADVLKGKEGNVVTSVCALSGYTGDDRRTPDG
jgi:hypothetical protein